LVQLYDNCLQNLIHWFRWLFCS